MFPSLLSGLPEGFDADKPPLGVVTPRPALVWPGPSGLVAGEECLIFASDWNGAWRDPDLLRLGWKHNSTKDSMSACQV